MLLNSIFLATPNQLFATGNTSSTASITCSTGGLLTLLIAVLFLDQTGLTIPHPGSLSEQVPTGCVSREAS